MKKILGRLLPALAVPVRIEGGARWWATNDWVGDAIYEGVFETYERQFVSRYLQPGMTMLDVGAHHGLYSVIAATRVGKLGRVISFEPSPRERARLVMHCERNSLDQVTIEPMALGKENGEATLYLPPDKDSGFNSLQIAEPLKGRAAAVTVALQTLDRYLEDNGITEVDLIKLDVEGGELDVLLGAERLLGRSHRPAILCEVEDERTGPWGYSAVEIIRLLEDAGYRWFLPRPGGRLETFDTTRVVFSHNLVALPSEHES